MKISSLYGLISPVELNLQPTNLLPQFFPLFFPQLRTSTKKQKNAHSIIHNLVTYFPKNNWL